MVIMETDDVIRRRHASMRRTRSFSRTCHELWPFIFATALDGSMEILQHVP